MTASLDLISRLARKRVDFVLVGGMAGVVHGSSLVTRDVDACARPTAENMTRLLAALAGTHPRDGRDAAAPMLERSPEDLAICDGFSLSTDIGRLDVIWDVPGVGAWPEVKAASEPIVLGDGEPFLVLGLDALIEAKRSLGRTRDLLAVEELEEIRRRRREQGSR